MNPNRIKAWTDTLTVPFELKASDSEKGTFEGYGNVFGVRDLVDDVVEPGAFARTIEQNKGTFPLLWFHDPTEPIGMLTASEDEHGLKVSGKLNLETQRGREVHSGMLAGYISQMSIGYKAIGKEVRDDVRHLSEVALREVSMLTANFAANPEAVVTGVKGDGERITPADAKALRDIRDAAEKVADDATDLLASVSVCEDATPSDAVKERMDALTTAFATEPAPALDPEPVDTSGIMDVLNNARATLAG